MIKKNILKIILDVVMTLTLVLLYNSHVFTMGFHEIAGYVEKTIKIPTKAAKPLCYIMLAGIVSFGSYSIVTSSFTSWLTEPFITISTDNNSNSIDGNNTQENGETSTNSNDKMERKQERTGNSNEHQPKSGENKKQGSGATSIMSTITTYISIIGVFSAIAYYVDKLTKKKA
jgi:hypothetical protein